MTLIAEFRLRTPLMGDAISQLPAIEFTFEDVAVEEQPGGDSVLETVVYWAEGETLDKHDEVIAQDELIVAFDVLANVSPQRRLYKVWLATDVLETTVYAEAMKQDFVVLDVHAADGTMTARVRVHDRDRFKSFLSAIRANEEFDVHVTGLYDEVPDRAIESNRFGVSSAQGEALEIAFDRGYFEQPRESSLEEIGEVMNLSLGAVSGRIRRGTRGLVRYFLENTPGRSTDGW